LGGFSLPGSGAPQKLDIDNVRGLCHNKITKERIQMAIFIANENGDWWEYQPNRVIYVLDTDDLPASVAEEWDNGSGEIEIIDENLAFEYGRRVDQDILVDF
jgi:hypothetical protein